MTDELKPDVAPEVKAAPAKPTGAPTAPAPKKPEPPKKTEPLKYRLNTHRPSGSLRTDLGAGVYMEMCKRWGDIMRCIPSHRFSTFEEILQNVWDWEKRQYRKGFNRTRKQVEDAVNQMTEAKMLEIK